MALVFNPFTGNFDNVMASSSDMSFSGGSLNVNGDLTLDSGGTFTTTVQAVTPTANRTISFPDQTGTVGLVSGATGNIQYNNAGQLAGTGDLNVELDWTSASGTYTGLKVSADNGVGGAPLGSGNLLDLQSNGTSKFSVSKDGNAYFQNGSSSAPIIKLGTSETGLYTRNSAARVSFAVSGFDANLEIGPNIFALASTGYIAWTSAALPSSAPDSGLKRDSAGVVAVTDGSTGLGTLQGQLRAQGTAPASATAAGTAGDIRYDSTHIYVCTATNTWVRAQLSTF